MLDGRYRIVTLLGRGGMGEIYRAEDLRLRQPVFADSRAAWVARPADQPTAELLLDAAAWRGRPVWLEVRRPGEKLAGSRGSW